ncbi:MAG: alkaline phosphatase, partial [Bacteroidales bacterium]|nr:alkaline phosphatase [Bacteroidales bacterium]
MERCTHVGLQKTGSADKYITDSAASGTALACGQKTNQGYIGVDTAGKELVSILKIADQLGKATGLVATSSITHATPASFIANQISRNMYEEIAADFLETDIDLFIGGGWSHFIERKDGRNLAEELEEKDYRVLFGMDSLDEIKSGKLACLTAEIHNPQVLKGRGDMLERATAKALELLSADEDGFFIMIEGSQIDWGGHDNDEAYVVSEILDFDRAVKVALDFAEKDGETLVIVTADHETGGMVVLDGDPGSGKISTKFTTGGHTASLIPVYAFGPGAQNFTGIYENTEVMKRMLKAFDF